MSEFEAVPDEAAPEEIPEFTVTAGLAAAAGSVIPEAETED